jgi:hypothetical protein
MLVEIKLDIENYSESVFSHMVRKSAEHAAVKIFGRWKDARTMARFFKLVDKCMFSYLVAAQRVTSGKGDGT